MSYETIILGGEIVKDVSVEGVGDRPKGQQRELDIGIGLDDRKRFERGSRKERVSVDLRRTKGRWGEVGTGREEGKRASSLRCV